MQWERPKNLFARRALTEKGWQSDVLVNIDEAGNISSVEASAKSPVGAPVFDLLLPGIANVHSHAFQYAMAGLTEKASGAEQDNFWSWREVMYKFLRTLTPEHIEIIARAFYIELLKHGYTAVGEFHYLHNDINGKPYANITELSDRIIAAAQGTGIHITHLPVLYETANFGGIPAHDGQKRFAHNIDSYLALLETLKKKYGNIPGVTLGVAPHSLRAVKPESLKTLLSALPKIDMNDSPIHIHIAEQEKEVADCIAWCNQRPVEWLLDHHNVYARWCLVHATHTVPNEVNGIASSGAVTGLCPSTEANLGDGIFSAEAYLKAGGKFGIGSDSNVCTSPWEELRQMEYAQRLTLRKRNVLCDESTPSVGRTLFGKVVAGGAQALGIRSGLIAPGQRADLIAVSTDAPLLAGKKEDAILDTLIFGSIQPDITDVFVGGNHTIKNGQHPHEKQSRAAMRKLLTCF